ncbi:hypothetical protein C6N40_03885 [Arenimonas caeni]|uniref:STAS/SEC14 domain-containing protein n=1 Tax=Arenimonas caeni TaxID=2058085 RepID=A0A2P6MBF2_9GAMM|nr:hypothetical protein C6N40_03885 [Arenimonas caeni]
MASVSQLPPDISIRYEDRPGYLHALVTGPRDSRAISIAYWSEVAAECRRRKAAKLMVVEKLGEFEGERDIEMTIDVLFSLGLDKLQVAFVVGRVELMGHVEHGEILARERGAVGRVFISEAMADHWLKHGSA